MDIVVDERFGLPFEFCKVAVTHANFLELENGIKSFYPGCDDIIIKLESASDSLINGNTYSILEVGQSLSAMFLDRSIESIVVVKGKYAGGGDPTYVGTFSVVHASFDQLERKIMDFNPDFTSDNLNVTSDSYESLSPNGFITAIMTGVDGMGRNADAFSVSIVVQARFGLLEESCDVSVSSGTFDQLEQGIADIYPGCGRAMIMSCKEDVTVIDASSYYSLEAGDSLLAGLTERSIQSIVVVRGIYGGDDSSEYLQAFPVVHSTCDQIRQAVKQKNPGCVLNRLEILHPGNIFLLNEDSYESLTANGFITAHVTLKGKSNIGSCYSTIDAFNSRVLNFNSSKKFVR